MQIEWLALSPSDARSAGFLVMLRDGDHFGVGEIVASAPASVVELLAACVDRLKNADGRNLNAYLDAISEVTDRDAAAGNAVRAGLEMCLYDLNGKVRGCAVHAMLGGHYRDTIALSRHVASGEPLPTDGSALRLQYRREPSRLAGSFGQESALGWIAKAISRSETAVQLDIDADGQFDNPALARAFIESLLSGRPRLNVALQQPLDADDLAGHAELCEALTVPVILDASVRSAKLMAQIIRLGAADRVVLNVERVGGLRPAMRIVALAEAAAIGVSVATHAQTAVGAAAALHLAAALHDTFPAQLDRLVPNHSAVASPGFSRDTIVATLGAEVGLGVTLSDAALAAFRPAA